MRGFLSSTIVALACLACSDTSTTKPNEPSMTTPPGRVASTRGGAIVLSRDEKIAVATNRTAGAVTVLRLDPSKPPAELVVDGDMPVAIDTGPGSEPWAAVIGADDDTAYVVLRRERVVQRVSGLRGSPKVDGSVEVGSEPTAIAISPTGDYLFVANWNDGTLSVVTTDPFEELSSRIDMNEKLVLAGELGSVEPRPGLAHPRALAMTDSFDDDDDDEMLYLTEFYSQPLSGVEDDDTHLSVDRNRQGLVYSFPVSGRGVSSAPVLRLEPVPETGFSSADDQMTSCFPNQLYAAAADAGRLFVTSLCASPRGPVGTKPNVQTTLHPTVFVTDLQTQAPLAPVVLTHELQTRYDADGATPAERRMPLIPNDIVFARASTTGGVRSAYVTAFGADALFRLDFNADGSLHDIGVPGARFIDLRYSGGGGTLPIGIALSTTAAAPFALVLNDNTQNVSIVDRATDRVVAAVDTTADDPSTGEPSRAKEVRRTEANSGRRRFATGLDVWSLDGQAWSSCESCHPDGLSDGITWFFTRGPRRTISTASTYYDASPTARRIMLWTANVDEVHDVEGITRSVSGGAGGILWQYEPHADCRLLYDGKGCDPSSPAGTCTLVGSSTEDPCEAPKHTTTLLNGLNGSLVSVVSETGFCDSPAETCDVSVLRDWELIDAYVQSVRVPKSTKVGARGIAAPDLDRGIQLFREGRCAACHGGPGWSISELFYEPGPVENGSLPYLPPETGGVIDLVGRLRTTQYGPDSGFPRLLNPPTLNGDATLRSWAPSAPSEAAARDYAYDTGLANDQINCVLRSVGTFPEQTSPDTPTVAGIVASGAPAVFELRQDMATLAFGATGFNPPSLLGLATRAPYYHAGNARTLEEVFDEAFSAHYRAIVSDFLPESPDKASQVRALVSFLLSIDESTQPEPVPTDLGFNPVLCPPTMN
jgi:DNA-binding beta-propeller fold protein YncE